MATNLALVEDETDVNTTSDVNISFREVVALLARSWPYYRPQLKHLLALLAMSIVSGGGILVTTAVGMDILNNAVLVGEPITDLQADLFFVDETYVLEESAEADTERQLLSDEQRHTLRNHFFAWSAVLGACSLAIYAGGYWYMVWIFARINQALRVVMVERAEHLSLRYHSESRTGDAMYRIYQDSATITNVFRNLVISPLRGVVWLLGAFLFLLAFSPTLALISVVTAVPVCALFYYSTPHIRHWARQARETNSNLTSWIQEVFTGIKVIKSNRAEGMVLDRFVADSQQALDAAFYLRFSIACLKVGVTVCFMMALLVMEYLMADWTITEKATFLGGTVAFVGFAVWNLGAFQTAVAQASQMNVMARELAEFWGIGQDLVVGLKRAFFLLDLEPEVTEVEHPQAFPIPIASVTWKDVNFTYTPDKPPVLQGVNLQAESGSITAIVGSTGTGKSTLMSLLLRLYDPDSGEISINGTPISQMKINELRGNVAIALQKNVLFAKSIAENIAYAADATRAQIEAAAKVACAHDFILEMPDGYDTELGERGGKLSTGQRQRLSIARAILRDTPVLILDEPTASLDAQTEHQVLRNLREWGQERVVFLITHRLSTIRNANQIAFMKDGTVCELGSHDALMKLDAGHYRDFVETELYGIKDQVEASS